MLSRFLVSGSDDEMIHIHDITVSMISPAGRTEREHEAAPLRCLHDARGSGIVRVACLNESPLTLAEV